jgi:hypothetical protein
MQYMVLVHYNDEDFGKLSEIKQQQILAESVQTYASVTRQWTICERIAVASSGDCGDRSGA